MTGGVFKEAAVRCGRELTARGQVMQQIGKSLQQRNASGQPKGETSPQ